MLNDPSEIQDSLLVRVRGILEDVVRRRAAGESLSDDEVLAHHSELGVALESGLEKLRLIERAGYQAELPPSDTGSIMLDGTPKAGGLLRIRCPHCREANEIGSDTELSDIVCRGCGSQFELAVAGDATSTAASLKTLAHFDLIERVGMGSFGTVWKGHDRELDRTVAVKIPRAGSLDELDVEKFLREARAAAQLKHPNIVSVHEVGREGDVVFIVSDYVRGVSLDQWLTGQPPTMQQAAGLCATVAEALQHAHERGVIHRDLKPANIMIDGDGQPHLMDFGLARRDAGEVTMTTDGQVLGTPAYMSPEQAQGDAHSADRRTDVYSLGVILFQLITAELPFRGNARMLMHQVIHEEPPSPTKFNPRIPRDLETITLKCLEKDPDRRYPTAAALANDLCRYLQGEPILARPISSITRTARWCQRNPTLTIASALTVGALLIGTITSTVFALRAGAARRSAVETLSESFAEIGVRQSNNSRPDLALPWFAESLAVAEGSPPDFSKNARFLSHALRLPRPVSAMMDKSLIDAVSIELHPRENIVLVRSRSFTSQLWNVDTRSHLQLPFEIRAPYISTWNSSGDSLIVAAGGDLYWMTFPDLALVRKVDVNGSPTALCLSPNEEHLIVALENRVVAFDQRLGHKLAEEATLEEPAVAFRFHPAGASLMAMGPSARGTILEFAPPSGVRTVDHPALKVGRAPHPFRGQAVPGEPVLPSFIDPSRILYLNTEGAYCTIDFGGTENTTRKLTGPDFGYHAIDAEGNTTILCGRLTAEIWSLKLHQRIASYPSPSRVTDARMRADQRFAVLAFQSGEVIVLDLATRRKMAVLPHYEVVSHCSSIQGSSRIATLQIDGLLRVWEIPAMRSRPRIDTTSAYARIKCSPEGTRFAVVGWHGWCDGTDVPRAVYDPDGQVVADLSDVPLKRVMGIDFSGSSIVLVGVEEAAQCVILNSLTGVTKSIALPGTTPIDVLCLDDPRLAVVLDKHGLLCWVNLENKSIVRTQNLGSHPIVWVDRYLVENPADDSFAVVCGNVVHVWNAQGQRLARLDHTAEVKHATYSPDGTLLATAGILSYTKGESPAPGAWLYSCQNYEVVRKLPHPSWVFSIEFSSDGKRLATACRDRMARVWTIDDSKQYGRGMQHDDEVFHARYLPDDAAIITVCRDGRIRLWDATSLRPLSPPLEVSSNMADHVELLQGNRLVSTHQGHDTEILSLIDYLATNESRVTGEDARLLSLILTGSRASGWTSDRISSNTWFDAWLLGSVPIERLRESQTEQTTLRSRHKRQSVP